MHALIDEEYDQLFKDRDTVRQIFPRGQTKVALPCNMQRMILNAQKIFNLNKLCKSDIDPKTIVDSVRELTKRLIIVSGEDRLSIEAQKNATMLFNIHMRSTMCSKRVIEEYFLSTQAFQYVIGEIETKFNAAIAHPGIFLKFWSGIEFLINQPNSGLSGDGTFLFTVPYFFNL